ncbi:hypothetical protein J1614_000419 [Plenodomus biglobosus]|nr:hypothetical protein J1614_000419 [Plenodomus biglobosus]
MKFSLTTSLVFFFLLSIAAAVPASVTSDDNDAVSFEILAATDPIDFLQAPPQSAKKPCGGHDYSGKDILLAAQKAVDLQLAGQTRGKGKYPHAINSDDSKGHRLIFLPNCPADTNRMEYPLKKDKPYDGGKNNKSQGDERVVYYYQKGKRGSSGHPKVVYCGLITHKGAKAKGGFVNCPA